MGLEEVYENNKKIIARLIKEAGIDFSDELEIIVHRLFPEFMYENNENLELMVRLFLRYLQKEFSIYYSINNLNDIIFNGINPRLAPKYYFQYFAQSPFTNSKNFGWNELLNDYNMQGFLTDEEGNIVYDDEGNPVVNNDNETGTTQYEYDNLENIIDDGGDDVEQRGSITGILQLLMYYGYYAIVNSFHHHGYICLADNLEENEFDLSESENRDPNYDMTKYLDTQVPILNFSGEYELAYERKITNPDGSISYSVDGGLLLTEDNSYYSTWDYGYGKYYRPESERSEDAFYTQEIVSELLKSDSLFDQIMDSYNVAGVRVLAKYSEIFIADKDDYKLNKIDTDAFSKFKIYATAYYPWGASENPEQEVEYLWRLMEEPSDLDPYKGKMWKRAYGDFNPEDYEEPKEKIGDRDIYWTPEPILYPENVNYLEFNSSEANALKIINSNIMYITFKDVIPQLLFYKIEGQLNINSHFDLWYTDYYSNLFQIELDNDSSAISLSDDKELYPKRLWKIGALYHEVWKLEPINQFIRSSEEFTIDIEANILSDKVIIDKLLYLKCLTLEKDCSVVEQWHLHHEDEFGNPIQETILGELEPINRLDTIEWIAKGFELQDGLFKTNFELGDLHYADYWNYNELFVVGDDYLIALNSETIPKLLEDTKHYCFTLMCNFIENIYPDLLSSNLFTTIEEDKWNYKERADLYFNAWALSKDGATYSAWHLDEYSRVYIDELYPQTDSTISLFKTSGEEEEPDTGQVIQEKFLVTFQNNFYIYEDWNSVTLLDGQIIDEIAEWNLDRDELRYGSVSASVVTFSKVIFDLLNFNLFTNVDGGLFNYKERVDLYFNAWTLGKDGATFSTWYLDEYSRIYIDELYPQTTGTLETFNIGEPETLMEEVIQEGFKVSFINDLYIYDEWNKANQLGHNFIEDPATFDLDPNENIYGNIIPYLKLYFGQTNLTDINILTNEQIFKYFSYISCKYDNIINLPLNNSIIPEVLDGNFKLYSTGEVFITEIDNFIINTI